MAEVTMGATPNGPYLVRSAIELRDADGNILPTKSKVWLPLLARIVSASIEHPSPSAP